MAGNKPLPTGASVTAVMAAIDYPGMRADAKKIAAMTHRATGRRARMRGPGPVHASTLRYRMTYERHD